MSAFTGYFFSRDSVCVPLPAPGAPSMTRWSGPSDADDEEEVPASRRCCCSKWRLLRDLVNWPPSRFAEQESSTVDGSNEPPTAWQRMRRATPPSEADLLLIAPRRSTRKPSTARQRTGAGFGETSRGFRHETTNIRLKHAKPKLRVFSENIIQERADHRNHSVYTEHPRSRMTCPDVLDQLFRYS